MAIPYLYDRISENNLKTATEYNKGGLIYLDLDISRDSYGKQLVPCILKHAVSFGVTYEGFAECSVNGVVGYLPRNCKFRESIENSDLITENQVLYLSKNLNGVEGYNLSSDIILSYFNLTGEILNQENVQVLKKDLKPKK